MKNFGNQSRGMTNVYRSFSSRRSLHSSTNVEIKQVLEHVTNLDVHEKARHIDQKHEKIATDLIRKSSFLLTTEENFILMTNFTLLEE